MKLYFLAAPLVYLLSLATGLSDNVCDWVNASPILYHEYGDDACPPELRIQPDGSCPMKNIVFDVSNVEWFCGGFCQVKTTYVYGLEQPFTNAYCHGPYSCTLGERKTLGFNYKLKLPFNFNLLGFKFGITGGISGSTNGLVVSQSRHIELSAAQCGYWTFLPIYKDTCGTYTETYAPNDQCANPKTYGNVCIYQPQDNGDGETLPYPKDPTMRGDIVFVWTNCSNRQRLPMENQDPAYQHPGVALDQGLYEGYSELWGQLDNVTLAPSVNSASTTCQTGELSAGQKPAFYTDCQHAVADLLNAGNATMPVCNNGSIWAPGQDGECATVVYYDQNWDSDCVMSMVQVAAGALTLLNGDCPSKSNGDMSGWQTLRSDGRCNSRMWLTNPDNMPQGGCEGQH